MKEYKKTMIVTSIITILPMLIGLMFWSKLPDTIATHFGANNVPNGWSSKPFAIIGIPLLLVVLHWITVGITLNDPKKKNIGKMMMQMILWTVPVISFTVNMSVIIYALGMKMDIGLIANILVGFVFMFFGNYMSKNQQNYTVGIRLPWTLSSEENWNRTHRLASKIWFFSGIVFIANAFYKSTYILFVVLFLTVIVPAVYSFIIYKREQH